MKKVGYSKEKLRKVLLLFVETNPIYLLINLMQSIFLQGFTKVFTRCLSEKANPIKPKANPIQTQFATTL